MKILIDSEEEEIKSKDSSLTPKVLNYMNIFFNFLSFLNQLIPSSSEGITVLFFLFLLFLTETYLILYFHLDSLIESKKRSRLIKFDFIISLLNFPFVLFYFVEISYYFASFIKYITLILIYTIMGLCMVFILSLYLMRKKRFLNLLEIWLKKEKWLKNWLKKFILILGITLYFSIPLYIGAIEPLSDPKVEVSPKPIEIFYERGGQIQSIKEVEINVKAIEGYAWNINISVETPESFYIWIDGIENEPKFIEYLKHEQKITFPLEIQPSYVVPNGTYAIKINWCYENARGDTAKKSEDIHISIGIEPGPAIEAIFILITIEFVLVFMCFFTNFYFIKKKNEEE